MIEKEEMSFLLIARRRDLNLTQLELANKLGVSQSRISKIENGKLINDLPFWITLLNVLNLDLKNFKSWVHFDATVKIGRISFSKDPTSTAKDTLISPNRSIWEKCFCLVILSKKRASIISGRSLILNFLNVYLFISLVFYCSLLKDS